MSKKNKKDNTIVNKILEEYDPKSVEDVQDALKEVFGPLFEAMLQGEMDHHLGYKNNNKDFKNTSNRRNGYGSKTLKTTMGEIEIDVPRDRDASFEPEVVQRCIVHLIRNSLKYVPSKDYKTFTASLKKVYAAPSFKAYKTEYEKFKNDWRQYPGAIDVWERNIIHVEQLYDYSSDIRRIMYITNPIEAVHPSFRKVTKKGPFLMKRHLLNYYILEF